MPKNNDEQYLDFLKYQEVDSTNVFGKAHGTITRKDHKAMAKAAKQQAKEDRKRGR